MNTTLFRKPPDAPPATLLVSVALSFVLHLLLFGWLLMPGHNGSDVAASASSPAPFTVVASLSSSQRVDAVLPLPIRAPEPLPAGLDVAAGSQVSRGVGTQPTPAPERLPAASRSDVPRPTPAPPAVLAQSTEQVPVVVPDQAAPSDIAEQPVYFLRSKLSVPPRLQDEPSIEFPDTDDTVSDEEVRRIRLRLFVSAVGVVDRAEIEGDTLSSPYADVVIAAFRPLHFVPGEIDGRTVGSQVVFEIDVDRQAPGSSRASDRAGTLEN